MRFVQPALAAAWGAALFAVVANAQDRRGPTIASDSAYEAYFRGAQDASTSIRSSPGVARHASAAYGEPGTPVLYASPIARSTPACTACPTNGACQPSCCPAGCASEEEEDACGCKDEEDEGPWRLFGEIPFIPNATKDCCGREPLSFFFGGWIQGGITANTDGNASVSGNFPVPFNQVADGFVFNQAPWVYAEKAVDTEERTWDWGFRVDYVFGTDAADTQAFGDQDWDFGWNSSRDYGSAIPQLYAELAVADLSVRMGHFFTIIGYEVVPATGNFFYSHALTMNYGEPFTHTGALARFAPNDTWTFYGGYTFGWDSGWENYADAHTFLGGITYAWEELATFYWAVNAGQFGDGGPLPQGGVAADGNIYMNSFVASVNLTEELVYVFQHDLAVNSNLPGGVSTSWYGINQYLFYTLGDTLKLGGRFEWFDDPDGVRIGPANPAGAGAFGDYFECTVGLNWTPHRNFTLRPEMRWDWFSGTAPAGALPYDNGTDDSLLTFGVDGIVQF